MLLIAAPVAAQEATPQDDVRNHPWQVFLTQDAEGVRDRLTFVDLLTGEQSMTLVDGERYTIFGRAVMFFDRATKRVVLAAPDGSLRQHPFIRLEEADRRVDWVLSADSQRVAWTITRRAPEAETTGDNLLNTVTFIAGIDGADLREVWRDGPRRDVRALPIALTGETLYLDAGYLDGLDNFTDFRLHAGIVAVDINSAELMILPDEQPANCLCGAAVGRGMFLRLRFNTDLSGFNFHAYNLSAGTETSIPTVQLNNYDIAGDILMTPDGQQAVYTLARVTDFGSAEQSSQTVFVLVDLVTMTQEQLTNPITTFVVPVGWTEDNSALLLTSPLRDGTWKINLRDGRLERIAESTYIGELS